MPSLLASPSAILMADFEAVLVRSLATPQMPWASDHPGHGEAGSPAGRQGREHQKAGDLRRQSDRQHAGDAEAGGQPAADQVGGDARCFIEQEQERQRERRIAELEEVQQHQHAQRAIREGEAPVGGGDDGVVAGPWRHGVSDPGVPHVAGEIDHAAGIAHLVVVPGIDLEQRAVGDQGGQARRRWSCGCRGHSRPRPEAAAHTRGCRRADRRLRPRNSSLTSSRVVARFSSKTQSVSDALSTGARTAWPFELALEFRIDQRDGGGASGGRGLQRQHGASARGADPCAAHRRRRWCWSDRGSW